MRQFRPSGRSGAYLLRIATFLSTSRSIHARADMASNDSLVKSDSPFHPANLICELCNAFYHLGWVTGTG